MIMENCEFFINGKWRGGKSYTSLYSPYNSEKIGEIPIAEDTEVIEAVDSANEAREKMKNLTLLERAEILQRVVKIFERRFHECVDILIRENSKPIRAARQEISRTIETYQFAAEEAKRLSGEIIPLDAAKTGKSTFGFTKLEPLGVIAAITPFNFPFNLVAHKLGPAFAVGNTVVLKPASQTPLSAIMTAKIFEEAGLPKGALNLLFGSGNQIGDLIVENNKVKMITFTGSVEVGKKIKEKAGLKKVTLELGSNSAVIIDSENNLEKIAKRCVEGAFGFSGQTCISVQRIYVKNNVFEEFLRYLVEETSKIKSGDPKNEDTIVSSLISLKDAKRVEEWIKSVNLESVLVGGRRNGSIVEPTILANVDSSQKISCEEVFGPTVVVNKVNDMEEAIREVNNSKFGLQAGVYTDSINDAFVYLDKIEVGGVIINDIPTFRVDQMPYGGVKESGVGKEGIKYSMEEMSESKLCVVNLNN